MKKTILITGGAGFIGSHLAEYLLHKNYRVLVIDNLSTGKIENIQALLAQPDFQFIRSSITDALVMDRLASESNIIIHLAAVVGVQLIVEKTVHTIETNIMGTEMVLQSALRYGARVLIASTSEVYGKGNRLPFQEEDDVLLGSTSKSRWAYAASKMVDEFLGLAYQQEHQLEVVPFRLFNTVGPRQTGQYGMVVPRFISQALQNQEITVHGNGEQSRCFCHVSDVIRAITALAEHPKSPGRVYNIGSKEEISILQLAEKIKAFTGSRSKIKMVPYSEAYGPGFEDMQRRIPDTKRLKELINWETEKNLDSILKDVTEYERYQLDKSSSIRRH